MAEDGRVTDATAPTWPGFRAAGALSVRAAPLQVLRSLDADRRIEASSHGDRWLLFVERDWLSLPGPTYDTPDLESLFLSLALLPALLLATPVAWLRRLAILVAGMIALWIVHVASVFVLAGSRPCPYPNWDRLCFWLYGNVALGGQLFAVAIWAALTWSYWLGLPHELEGDDGESP